MQKFVAYYRVSTALQGRSGLGLAAQKHKVADFCKPQGTIIAEFFDVQSGRRDKRLALQEALSVARKERAALVIAKLDRFSRRVSFIANIMDQRVQLVCAEMPNASDFQLHIFAALAQEERRLISVRTKAALAEAKRRGVILGSNGKYLAAKNRQRADQFAESLREFLEGRIRRFSYSRIADELNDLGVCTRTGAKFFPQTVKNYAKRLDFASSKTLTSTCLPLEMGSAEERRLETNRIPTVPREGLRRNRL